MPLSSSRSDALFTRAQQLIPAGVSSPVRAFRKVGGGPKYIARGEGAQMWDEDGNRYLDFCMAWGPLILGHSHPAVIEAVTRATRDGLAFGCVHRHEVELAELVLSALTEHERVRFVCSGTEAVTTALRLARGFTGRQSVLKFTGCYHGHVDALLVRAGSGVVTQGLADSQGVPESIAATTIVVPLDDDAAMEEAFARYGSTLACAITEPLPANNGLLPQRTEWLKKLRTLCDKHGALLILDEVINAFRFHFGSFGKLSGVKADLTTMGKIVGGGLPVAAVAGRRELMEKLAPLGPVYQAGTMAGNPVALAAGIATLKELQKGEVYKHIDSLGKQLETEWAKHRVGKLARVQRIGSLFWPYAQLDGKLPTQAEAISSKAIDAYHGAYRRWLEAGVYLQPSGYEVSFLSAAHRPEDVSRLLDVLAEGLS